MKKLIVILLIVLCSSCAKKEVVPDKLKFLGGFSKFAIKYNPKMDILTRLQLGSIFWMSSGGDIEKAAFLASMAMIESSLRVRKYHDDVLQRTDYMGAHYIALWASMRMMGVVRGKYDWTQFQKWKKEFKDDPQFGTMLACLWFNAMSLKVGGYDNTAKIWLTGSCLPNAPRHEEADAYLAKAKKFQAELLGYARQK